MLILSRKRGEAILLGDDIQVIVMEIKSDKVRLGIEAPRGVKVHREEIYEAIKRSESDESSCPSDV